MQIQRIENNPVSSNCFIISENSNSIIIDPGSSDDSDIIKAIGSNKVDYIILTHEHFDHIWSTESLRKKYADAKVIATTYTSMAITDEKKNLSRFHSEVGIKVHPADIVLDKNETLMWNGLEIEFILTPGHSQGSMCIKIENHIFTGDTIIKGIKGVTKLPGGNKDKLQESIDFLQKNYRHLNPVLHCGHGKDWLLQEV